MIFFVSTIGQLRREIEDQPDDMPVVGYLLDVGTEVGSEVDEGISAQLVYVDESGLVVGTEGEDYKPKEGEIEAWLIR